MKSFERLYVKTDRAHQFEGVAALSHSGYEAIIKTQLAIFQAVFEVEIRRLQICIAGHLSERQIVSSDESDCALRDQTSGKGRGSNAAIVGIGAAEQFVQQK